MTSSAGPVPVALSSPSAVTGTTRPSPNVMLPSTRTARRRMSRAGVLSRRWARDRKNAPAAASTGATASEPVWATYPVSTGNAPQAAAKPASVCITPPNSSAL